MRKLIKVVLCVLVCIICVFGVLSKFKKVIESVLKNDTCVRTLLLLYICRLGRRLRLKP